MGTPPPYEKRGEVMKIVNENDMDAEVARVRERIAAGDKTAWCDWWYHGGHMSFPMPLDALRVLPGYHRKHT